MDIIRRILQGYFGYNVNFVQNVTDIDDKVIACTWLKLTPDYYPRASKLYVERISQISPTNT